MRGGVFACLLLLLSPDEMLDNPAESDHHCRRMLDVDRLARDVLASPIDPQEIVDYYDGRIEDRRAVAQALLKNKEELLGDVQDPATLRHLNDLEAQAHPDL